MTGLLPYTVFLPEEFNQRMDYFDKRISENAVKLLGVLYSYKLLKAKINRSRYTWGQEIETDYINPIIQDLTKEFLKGDYDASGPWEFILYPTKYHDSLPGFIIAEMQRLKLLDIKPQDEMGNHLHYRPAPLTNAYLWWKSYLNIYVLSILYLRMLSSHGDYLRSSWNKWAALSPQFDYLLNHKPNDDELQEFYEEMKYWDGRDYYHVTFNRHRKKTLTLEVRLCEAHPLKAWAFVYLLTKINKLYDEPIFLVDDMDKLKDFYYAYADGEILIDFSWNEVGLKPIIQMHDRLDYKFLIKLYNSVLTDDNPKELLARTIFDYIYIERKNIVDRTTVIEFYRYLKTNIPKKKKEMLSLTT